jgi:hypothetical protein
MFHHVQLFADMLRSLLLPSWCHTRKQHTKNCTKYIVLIIYLLYIFYIIHLLYTIMHVLLPFVYCLYSCMTSWWQQKRPKHVGEQIMITHNLLMYIYWFVASINILCCVLDNNCHICCHEYDSQPFMEISKNALVKFVTTPDRHH